MSFVSEAERGPCGRDLPDTRETPARVHVVDVLGARLQAAAEEEDDGADEDGHLAAEHVADGAGEHGAEEGAAGENGHDCAAVRRVLSVTMSPDAERRE